jgi:pimeloyl-ACP methyl ester carboxylesterase
MAITLAAIRSVVIFVLVSNILSIVYGEDKVNNNTLRFNGWYACGPTDSIEETFLRYECGKLQVPMCHKDICESEKTIDLFIKRLKAATTDIKKKSVWVLQGGPGASSSAMENLMDVLYTAFHGEFNVYTMDHRGTGRSFFLSCDASQAYSNGSPGGIEVIFEEYPACIQDILFQIENHTIAFSVTSAAMDLVEAIDYFHKDHDVYVYGVSYGTYLVERLVHLGPLQVKGYILDGIESEKGPTFKERSGFSRPNEAAQEVAIRYFGYCQKDLLCASKLKTLPRKNNSSSPLPSKEEEEEEEQDLVERIRALYERIDTNENNSNDCALYFASKTSNHKASYYLRMAFENSIMDPLLQRLVPAVFYRLNRCDEQNHGDLSFLKRYDTLVMEKLNSFHSFALPGPPSRLKATTTARNNESINSFSLMLYNLIVYSELWEIPSPSVNDFHQSLDDSIIGSTTGEALVRDYCLFTGKTKKEDKACEEFDDLLQVLKLPERPPAFVYPHDKYWNRTSHLPEQATALLLSGRLDLLTSNHFAVQEYKNIHGEVLLVEFDYAGHGVVWETPTIHPKDFTCGIQILISYISNDGQINQVDTSCIDDVIPLEFQLTKKEAQLILGVDEIYDAKATQASEA